MVSKTRIVQGWPLKNSLLSITTPLPQIKVSPGACMQEHACRSMHAVPYGTHEASMLMGDVALA